jgi:replicative DNA helicase
MAVRNPRLIIIAARPSMGKTSFAQRGAACAIRQEQPVGIFSANSKRW